jgi:hypothetical protein
MAAAGLWLGHSPYPAESLALASYGVLLGQTETLSRHPTVRLIFGSFQSQKTSLAYATSPRILKAFGFLKLL